MPSECLDQSILRSVPDLQLASMSAHSKERSVATPLDARNTILRADVAELRDLAISGGPEVEARSESNSKNILSRPVHKVQVEIILKTGSVEHLEWLLRYLSLLLIGLR